MKGLVGGLLKGCKSGLMDCLQQSKLFLKTKQKL
jgi:hypothetical protein